MATVRHKVMKEADSDAARKGEIIKEEFSEETYSSRSKLIDIVEEIEETINNNRVSYLTLISSC